MGFAQHTHDNMNRGNSVSNTTFFDFRLRAEEKSPEATIDFASPGEPPENIYGWYEVVWFLNSVSHTPVFKYHETLGQDQVLCAKTFPESGDQCPACNEYDRLRASYGGGKLDAEVYKKLPVKAAKQKLILPVYAPRRAKERHIFKGTTEVFPIYWFHLKADGFPPEAQESYLRLRKCDETNPMSQFPYLILKKPRPQGEKDQFYFKPLAYDPNSMGVYAQHPLLQAPFLNPQNPAQKGWGQDYYDLMELLPILQFARFVDPATGQPHEYFGYYQRALQMYEYAKQHWPAPCRRLEQSEMQVHTPQFAAAAPLQQPGAYPVQGGYGQPQQPQYQQQYQQPAQQQAYQPTYNQTQAPIVPGSFQPQTAPPAQQWGVPF
jgi:hypothetical protein